MPIERGIDGDIFVNGRFLSRPTTGVERFATMILREVDKSPDSANRYTLLAPRGVKRPEWLTNMAFRNVGQSSGHPWEQVELYRASRKGVLLNLCNAGPVLHKRSLTILHDASVFRYPDHFRASYRIAHQWLGRLLARRSTIGTVSEFSRSELADVLEIPGESIVVIPNATDHVDDMHPDESILDSLGVRGRPFLLLVGSFAPNKNMKRAIEAFKRAGTAEQSLVIVGAPGKSFANSRIEGTPGKVILAGRLDDARLMALYQHCTALLFPSIYEGFGIPPLEAMRCGRPVLAADIPPVRAVCAGAARYFDPFSVEEMADCIRQFFSDTDMQARFAREARRRALDFSWVHSSEILQRTIKSL